MAVGGPLLRYTFMNTSPCPLPSPCMRSFKNWAKRALTTVAERAIPRSLRDRLIRHYSIPNVDWSLRNARDNGFSPETIVDVGAYVGEWSRMAHQTFPGAEILAVEPQHGKEKELKALSEKCGKVRYEIALLGAESKQDVTFRLSGSNSKALLRGREEPDNEQRDLVQHDMTTLDALTSDTIFAQPDFLKLDVQFCGPTKRSSTSMEPRVPRSSHGGSSMREERTERYTLGCRSTFDRESVRWGCRKNGPLWSTME